MFLSFNNSNALMISLRQRRLRKKMKKSKNMKLDDFFDIKRPQMW